MPTDAELLGAYAENRSETAFAELVERRIGFAYGTALRQLAGDAHLAQDVTQAVFSLVAKKAATLACHECLAGWLYTTTTHVARRTWRNARSRRRREEEAVIMSEIQNISDSAAVSEEEFARLRPLLDELLGELREGEREAVLLRFFEGRGFVEIGVALRLSEDAARMRVARALEKMRVFLSKRGVKSSVAALSTLMAIEATASVPAGMATVVSAGAISSCGATVAAVSAGAAFAFISSIKITVAAAVALCLATGVSYYGGQRQSMADAKLAEAKIENATLVGQLAAAERKTKFLKDRAAPDGPPSMWASADEAEAALMAGRKLLAEHPDIKAKLNAAGRSLNFPRSYWIAHEMGLTAEQSAFLAEISATGFTSTNRDIPGYGAVTLQSEMVNNGSPRQREEKIREFLGDDGLAKYNELSDRYYAVSRYSKGLASALNFTDTPLTELQSQALAQVCLELKKSQGNYADAEAWWAGLLGQARQFLAEEQIVVLSRMGDYYQSDYVRWQQVERVFKETKKASK